MFPTIERVYDNAAARDDLGWRMTSRTRSSGSRAARRWRSALTLQVGAKGSRRVDRAVHGPLIAVITAERASVCGCSQTRGAARSAA